MQDSAPALLRCLEVYLPLTLAKIRFIAIERTQAGRGVMSGTITSMRDQARYICMGLWMLFIAGKFELSALRTGPV